MYNRKDIIVADTERPCIMCGSPTCFIEIATEARVCKPECLDQLLTKLNAYSDNDPCHLCAHRGFLTTADVACCNCCEDYEFFVPVEVP